METVLSALESGHSLIPTVHPDLKASPPQGLCCNGCNSLLLPIASVNIAA